MSETVEQIEATWAANDRTTLETALAALPKQGVAHTPVVPFEWEGRVSYVSRVSSTLGAIKRPTGIREEVAPVAGVFMQGPQNPTPLAWMDRLPEDRQIALMEALESTPRGRHFARRLSAARNIDPTHPQTEQGIAMLAAAGIITEDEAATLRAP